MHNWHIVFQHDRQGFRKAFGVQAVGYRQAVTFAGDQLERRGYKRVEFEVIDVRRLSAASTEALAGADDA